MFVSRDFTSGEFGDESVDVIYIWNRELSSSEVAFLHAQPYCIFEKPDRLLYVPPPPLQPAVVSPDMQLPQLLAQ